jgi:hypothetical protein
MGVDDTGDHGFALQVDDAGSRTRQGARFNVGAGENDSITAHSERSCARAGGVHCVNAAVGENEIRGTLRSESAGCEQQQRCVGCKAFHDREFAP